MGCLRLCLTKRAEEPFYIASIGVNARSIEEICYFIVNETALLDESFVCRELARWFEEQLGMAALARTLEKVLAEDEPTAPFVTAILREEAYLSHRDMQAFERRLQALSRDSEAVRLKKKGDALVRCGRLAGAVNVYREVLRMEECRSGEVLAASVWHNIGVAHMQLLAYPEALSDFEKALSLSYTREALKDYLYVCAIARPREKYEEELKKRGVDDRTREEIDRGLREAAAAVRYPEAADMKSYLADLMREYHRAADV
ncbi:MAG: tetratricopeptide repeat protein [Lachnospiraceae bacterium]|nr:tetratricopeptide repeat protein [Lachnospiraceae bacterium]